VTDDQINDLRRRIDAGEPVTNEEIMAGLTAIRQARVNAPTAKAKGKDVTVAPIKIDLAALISKKNVVPGA
jgi:hypothetical protein